MFCTSSSIRISLPPLGRLHPVGMAGLNQSDFTVRGNGGNLRPDMHAAFVNYLTTVVHHFARDPLINITFDALEPFTEPIASAWFAGNRQEGCRFAPRDISSIIRLARREMRQKGMVSTNLAAYDESATPTLLSLRRVSRAARLLVHKLNVHGYSITQSYGTCVHACSLCW